MAWNKKGRGGRPRKIADRTANGRIAIGAIEHQGPIIPEEALTRRAEAIGGELGTEHKPMAGHALGQAVFRGQITVQQYWAADALASLWLAWASMNEVPTRPMAKTDSSGSETGPVQRSALQEERLKIRFDNAEAALLQCVSGQDVKNALGDLLLRETWPPHRARQALILRGLDAMAYHFRIPAKDLPRVA